MRFSIYRNIMSAAVAIVLASASCAHAQSYPDRPIKLIMPFGAGSASDSIARIVAEGLGERLGQRVIVENQAGAGGNIGTSTAAKAAPDGYTLVFAAPGPFVINKSLASLPYDPEKDFEPVSQVAQLVNVLVVNPDKVPVKNVQEFISYVRQRPGEVTYSWSASVLRSILPRPISISSPAPRWCMCPTNRAVRSPWIWSPEAFR
jgi:tripartite-type tricarboxylate transporter receptor subunit TctC